MNWQRSALLVLASLLIVSCSSKEKELESLCKSYVQLEQAIVKARRAGRSRAELKKPVAEYKRVCNELKKYDEMDIYQVLKRIPNSGYGQ